MVQYSNVQVATHSATPHGTFLDQCLYVHGGMLTRTRTLHIHTPTRTHTHSEHACMHTPTMHNYDMATNVSIAALSFIPPNQALTLVRSLKNIALSSKIGSPPLT